MLDITLLLHLFDVVLHNNLRKPRLVSVREAQNVHCLVRMNLLLALMKIRLGLLHMDLANRFSISISLCSQIFGSWVRAMALALRSMIYMPEQDVISATTPQRFHSVRGLHTIIDASELFIETQKDPKLQSSTWSSYKHHNTLKFLVAVDPNSMVTFISKVCEFYCSFSNNL